MYMKNIECSTQTAMTINFVSLLLIFIIIFLANSILMST